MARAAERETLRVHTQEDIVRARQLVRARAVELDFSLVDQTKLVTAASEIARNTVTYGGGGEMHVEEYSSRGRTGLRLRFVDKGPGIQDAERALQDGYSTSGGLGLGLGGSRRLVDSFEMETTPGKGTRVTLIKYRSEP